MRSRRRWNARAHRVLGALLGSHLFHGLWSRARMRLLQWFLFQKCSLLNSAARLRDENDEKHARGWHFHIRRTFLKNLHLFIHKIFYDLPFRKTHKLIYLCLQVVDMIENRVYVQMDKYTMSAADHKYAFVCELAPTPIEGNGGGGDFSPPDEILSHTNEIRRRPVMGPLPIVPQNAPKGLLNALFPIINSIFQIICHIPTP